MKRFLLSLALSLTALTASARNFYIPVAGVAPGANNTLFRTDVRIFNPTGHIFGVTLHFLPQGQDNTNVPGKMVFIGPRSVAALNNVVGDFFEYPTPVIGAIRVDSDTNADYPIIVESRTYTNVPGGAGTYGQFVPALEVSRANRNTVVTHISNSNDLSSGFRTNVGVMNPGREAVSISLALYRAEGPLVARATSTQVRAKSMLQGSLRQWFGPAADQVLADGFIVFEATAPVFTYASVVDNQSGDQFFVPGAYHDTEIRPVPPPD